MPQHGALGERGIDEDVQLALDLALGEGPELDRLHPSRECVGKSAQAENPCGPGQQVAARPRVGVDLLLDGEQQFRSTLNLVDDHELWERHEPGRIRVSGLKGRIRRGIDVLPGALDRLALARRNARA